MPVVFANPLGFWALLGLPLILLLHFLQRETRRETCTTLFLLETLQRDSAPGHRWDWLRQSVPLWLQLLCVLLLTWLLVEPRWHRPGSVQPIAFVVDSSASMQAFAQDTRRLLVEKASALHRSAAHTEFSLLDSASPTPALFRGDDVSSLAAALANWMPSHGFHDLTPALHIARNTVGHQGLVILVSDHRQESIPSGVHRLSVGSPLPNAGFAGLQVEDESQGPVWKALIRNYSAAAAQRQLSWRAGSQTSPPQVLDLAPGEIRTLRGEFPPGADSFVLQLTADAFPADDVLPVLAPRERTLLLSLSLGERNKALVESLLPGLAPVETTAGGGPPADLEFLGYDPLKPGLPAGPAVVFVDRAPRLSQPTAGQMLTADHPLMEDLSWDALIVRQDLGIPFRQGDTALLWLSGKPLIWLRDSGPQASPQLFLDFDPVSSNAAKLPAFILLLHRFAAHVRQSKLSLAREIAETHQILSLPPALDPSTCTGRFVTWDGREFPFPLASRRLALPGEPGFALIRHGDAPYLHLASHFADTREADLSQAEAIDELANLVPAQVLRHSETGGRIGLWLLLLAGILVFSWAWQTRRPA